MNEGLQPQQPQEPQAEPEPGESFLHASAALLTSDYEARLAITSAEVRAAQQLRHQSLYLEQGGHPDPRQTLAAADIDEWDERACHVIVICRSSPHSIVGTLRLTPSESLYPQQRFYTEHAFDISPLRQSYSRLLELSRFCIAPDRRQGGILRLIWKYTSQLIIENRIDLLLGCASFPGTDPQRHGASLSYLYDTHLAPSALSPTPVVNNHCELADFCGTETNGRSPLRGLPTLLRGYIKLGAKVSRTAIIDPLFNTTFVCVYADTAALLEGDTPLFRLREPAAGKHRAL